MILTDNMKRLIDTLNTYEPDLPNGFYSVKVLQEKLDFTAQFVLESLANDGLIRWGDKHHTGFWLLERARNYKNIEKLERIERWRERLLGFLFGAVTGVLTCVLTAWLPHLFG